MNYRTTLARLTGIAVRHPSLVPQLFASAWRFRARGWHRRPPFLPLPPGEYVAWRMHTAYGEGDALPAQHELKRFLRWAAWMRRSRRA